MSLTLAAAIAASARQLRVTGTVPGDIAPGYRFRLDDELLSLDAFAVTQNGKHAPRVDDRSTWLVSRGLDTSDPASHTAGIDVLGVADAFVSGNDEDEPSPFASGGSGGAGTLSEQRFDIPLATIIAAWDSPSGTADITLPTTFTTGTLIYDFVVRVIEVVALSGPTWQGVFGLYFGTAGSEEWLTAKDGVGDPAIGDVTAQENSGYTILGIPDPDNQDGPRTGLGGGAIASSAFGLGYMLASGSPVVRIISGAGAGAAAPDTGHLQISFLVSNVEAVSV